MMAHGYYEHFNKTAKFPLHFVVLISSPEISWHRDYFTRCSHQFFTYRRVLEKMVAVEKEFHISKSNINVALIRINPAVDIQDALVKIESVFKKYDPTSPFIATFVDAEYNRKFGNEKRVSTLALLFAVVAVTISCLGLFGLTAFVAERRTKEIGIRKVMGASVAGLWQMLSREFMILVLVSCLISMPLAYYYLTNWLQAYEYRTTIPWWVFVLACTGALAIALLTVSFRAIKAATLDPVKSLRSE